jgi:hypothetical protein
MINKKEYRKGGIAWIGRTRMRGKKSFLTLCFVVLEGFAEIESI